MSAELSPRAADPPGRPPVEAVAAAGRGRGSSYREILGSTVLIGGSSVLVVAIGVVRTKALALMLGPAGFGLVGLYTSIVELAQSVAGMGVSKSGVRQIADAAGSGDAARIAATITVLRRTSIALGLFGALALVIFAKQIAVLTFGTDAHADAVAMLSAAVCLRLVADGQGALIQGLRRIPDLARVSVIGPGLGTLASIPIVYYLREEGIVPALLAVAALAALTSWHYSTKVRIEPCTLSGQQFRQEASALLKLGVAFMGSGLLMMGAAFVVRLFVLREGGLDGAGCYQAAWTLGGLYVAFVLQAMGTDFYPRLVAAIADPVLTNRLVNEQTHVSLLLAGPGVIATLTFASYVIDVFYSAAFREADGVLRWICLGMALRVVSWPMGYVIVARNLRWLFLGVELAWALVNVGLSWVFVQHFGLVGAGMAFFASYVTHSVIVYVMVRRLSGFQWTAQNLRVGLLFMAAIGLVFIAFDRLPALWAAGVGVVALCISTPCAIRSLLVLVPPEQLPGPMRRMRGYLP